MSCWLAGTACWLGLWPATLLERLGYALVTGEIAFVIAAVGGALLGVRPVADDVAAAIGPDATVVAVATVVVVANAAVESDADAAVVTDAAGVDDAAPIVPATDGGVENFADGRLERRIDSAASAA